MHVLARWRWIKMHSLRKNIATLALLIAVTVPVRVLSTRTTFQGNHQEMPASGDCALPFRGKLSVTATVEPYETLQLKLEQIANKTRLYDMPKDAEVKISQELESEPVVSRIIQQCKAFDAKLKCDKTYLYRSFDGTCNNRKHPKWGSTYTPNERMVSPFYEGVYGLRKSVSGSNLPGARYLTLRMLEDEDHPSNLLSFFFVLFGQFVAHDITNTPIILINSSRPDCCGDKRADSQVCAPILLKPDDPFFFKFNKTCIDFVRSAPYASCNFGKREQMNAVTSYLDGSVIYGSNKEAADKLREQDDSGRMKRQLTQAGELLPPLVNKTSDVCPPKSQELCFVSGDDRVNEHTFLTSFHTLFVREHNRVSDNLRALNPKWTGDTIYQESRKIVGAELQCIVCKEFLPLLVGTELMNLFHLCEDNYDEAVNPSILSEFANAAYRLHSMVAHKFSTSHPQYTFMRTFSNPSPLHSGDMGTLLKEVSSLPAQKYDRNMISDVTNFLYKFPYETYGIDLPTINIQRGRDHGLAPYVTLAEKCSEGKYKISTFDDLNQLMPEKNVRLLEQHYKNVKDIDLFVGLLMEQSKLGVAGPTGNCILASQFCLIFSGDSFFYLNSGFPNSFKPNQLESIKTCSLARLLCENTHIREIHKNPLVIPSKKNPITLCDTVHPMDLEPWKEA